RRKVKVQQTKRKKAKSEKRLNHGWPSWLRVYSHGLRCVVDSAVMDVHRLLAFMHDTLHFSKLTLVSPVFGNYYRTPFVLQQRTKGGRGATR
mgnify:CR=1